MDFSNWTLFKQGAEARLYTGKFLGRSAIAKHRFPKTYRHPQLDDQLTRDRLKGEVRSLNRCKLMGIATPTILLADADAAVIILEFVADAVTCRQFLDSSLTAGDRRGAARISAAIGRLVGRMHKHNVIHGDLTTSNILVRAAASASADRDPDNGDSDATAHNGGDATADDDRLVIIDFGLGHAEGSAEDKGVDLYVLERALLSTHPDTEDLFEQIVDGYKHEMKEKECAEVMKKFEEIRMRGRKRTMVG